MLPEQPSTAAAAYAGLRAIDRRSGGLELRQRQELLRALQHAVIDRRQRLVQAVDADFGGRAAEETLLAEVFAVANAASFARRRLRRWARKRRVPVDLPFWPSRAWVVPQPLGVVGIVSPWNYPVQLALSPLVAAIAAGNRAALKPSEITPRAAEELAALVEAALGAEVARTVPGGPEVAADFVRQLWDHLLFTGSTERGRDVLRAAAEHLTPVTLELGGKCPAVVLPDADLDQAARAIVTGKILNAGQTCVAPDTALVVSQPADAVGMALARSYRELVPEAPPSTLVSDRQLQRLDRLVQHERLKSLGADGPGRRRALALAADPEPGSPLLSQELFGPVLPLVQVDGIDAAIEWINARPAPLAIYLFTHDREAERRVLASTRAGALVVNGTVVQAAIEALPFGGVGASGFGRYHGRAGFDTFSNMRTHVRVARFTLARMAEPPYTPAKRRLIEWLMRAARW
jgi:acyl-CoA reductase-like NAD-dependent aldehyde dehydrogenase